MNKSIRPWIRKAMVPTIALAAITLLLAGCPMPGGGGEKPPSSAKAITAFSFASPPATGTIDENAKTIAVTVPYGTDVTALVATFTTTGSSVKVGSTVQVSGVTTNNFSSPITYTVTAADSSTASYTVTVTVASGSEKAITVFSFASPAATGTIDEYAKTIAVTVPYGTDVTALVATFTTTGASVKVGSTLQVSGTTANNFSSPVTYTVTAADSSTASYAVTVTVGSWEVVGTQCFSAGTADSTSLAIDSAGTPYVAYVDGGNNGKATVMKYAGGSWKAVGTAGFSPGAAGGTSLAIDSTGAPYVAYLDGANGSRATVMKYAGGSWQAVGTAGFSAGAAGGISLAIDSWDTVYVAYDAAAYPYKATVMKYAGGSWQTVGTAGFTPAYPGVPSLAIDSTGTPYVAYMDRGNSDGATVVKYAGGSWQTVGTAGFSAHCAFHLSLAIDSADIPYVAYADGYGYPGSPATVMKCVSGSWQTVGTTGFSAGGATSPSLAIDSTGTPYVAYEDEAYNGRATLMKYAGGSWRTVGTVGFNWITNPYNIVQAIYPSLAIDSTGTPYVAFAELIYPYNFGATVMRFK